MAPEGEDYVVSCTSLTNWQPNPEFERMSHISLLAMLTNVENEFVRFLKTTAPDLASHPWIEKWLEGRA